MKRPPKSKVVEQSRTKAMLSARERQFQIAVAAFKRIVRFQSAHLSVFQTEVHELQREALQALVAMENVQRKKPLRMTPERGDYLAKVWKNTLYGRFGSPASPEMDD